MVPFFSVNPQHSQFWVLGQQTSNKTTIFNPLLEELKYCWCFIVKYIEYLCKWLARRQTSLCRDNKVVLSYDTVDTSFLFITPKQNHSRLLCSGMNPSSSLLAFWLGFCICIPLRRSLQIHRCGWEWLWSDYTITTHYTSECKSDCVVPAIVRFLSGMVLQHAWKKKRLLLFSLSLSLSFSLFFFFLVLHCHLWEIWVTIRVRNSGHKSSAIHSYQYEQLFCVQTMVWLPVFGNSSMSTDVDACELWLHTRAVQMPYNMTFKRVCTESWLWEKNLLLHWGFEPTSALHLAF